MSYDYENNENNENNNYDIYYDFIEKEKLKWIEFSYEYIKNNNLKIIKKKYFMNQK